MRPANQFALAAGVALALAGVAAAWWVYRPSPVAPTSGEEQVQVDPLPGVTVGDPGPAKLDEMLDRVEAAEAEKFGPAEAHRRRTQREQMLELRLHGEKDE